MRIFTVASGKVEPGARIDSLKLSNGVEIPAILIGEEGRGRTLGVLPVENPPRIPCRNIGKQGCETPCPYCGEEMNMIPRDHPDFGTEPDRLRFASIGQTKAGKPKLISTESPGLDDFVIVVLRTPIGYRGGNSHTGDKTGWCCRHCEVAGEGLITPEKCPECGGGYPERPASVFAEFPASIEVLATGQIAQGDAGNMGYGTQSIIVLPKDVVIRTGYSGRLYDAPSAHYYVWDGVNLLSATLKERMIADVF